MSATQSKKRAAPNEHGNHVWHGMLTPRWLLIRRSLLRLAVSEERKVTHLYALICVPNAALTLFILLQHLWSHRST